MPKISIPNHREAAILEILADEEKYGREIRDEYQKRTRKKMPFGSLYVTLRRMEDEKGFLKSRMGESTHERGGNRRKYYRLTADGERARFAIQQLVPISWARHSTT